MDDEERSVKPVAWAGFVEGYLQSVKINWSDDKYSKGPTGRTIKSGQPVYVKDMRTDPGYEPWREEALKRGYVSSIALPLVIEGKVLGTLNIYSSEPDAFDTYEIQLLMKLTDDLAYGIQALRTKDQHQRAGEALRKNEYLLRKMLEMLPVGVWLTDEKGILTYGNPMGQKIWGGARY